MSRINTNVSSLIAQNILGRSNEALGQSLERLSTGLRINRGKDDPSGLIASENLRSDIVSVKTAITNGQRANQIIATADSALSEVSGLLNDIRGLVTESANTGALSDAQIAANQLQLDSSLEALNRISQTTAFQGRKLLDGSLDFNITSSDSNFSKLSELSIQQGSLGSTGKVSVSVDISTAAKIAQVDIGSIAAVTAGVAATTSASFVHGATQATGNITLNSTNSAVITLTAKSGGAAAGLEGNDFTTLVVNQNASEPASYNASTNTLTVEADISGGGSTNTVTELAALINGLADFSASVVSDGADAITTATTNTTGSLTGGRDAGNAAITITAATTGTAFDGKTVTITETASHGTTPTASVDGSDKITVLVDDTATTTLQSVRDAINNLADYNATLTVTTGDGNFIGASEAAPVVGNTGSGVDLSGGLAADVTFQLSGKDGSDVFKFEKNASITNLVDGINLQKEATGVEATANGTTLELRSTAFGTNAFVDVQVISEVATGTFTTAIGQEERKIGTDVVATVNGLSTNGDGNELSIDTATLDLKTTVATDFVGSVSFNITGGGALFQLGPDVVSNQQFRLGIGSVNSARLGGVSGKLFDLRSGNAADLTADPNTAAKIVDEAINNVSSLRGRLGAFQKTTVDTNIRSLSDILVNLTDAESAIRDADFASETAALTRAQILVQSGTTVLSIANSNPQNVLSLLR